MLALTVMQDRAGLEMLGSMRYEEMKDRAGLDFQAWGGSGRSQGYRLELEASQGSGTTTRARGFAQATTSPSVASVYQRSMSRLLVAGGAL